MAKPKIILFDLETSLMEVSTFSLYPNSIPHQSIKQDWYIICAAWKELGKPKIHSVSVLDDKKRFGKNYRDDLHVVKTLADKFKSADVLIAHNLVAFDQKKLNARLIYHDLDPLPVITTVDTLKEARKIAKFSSNRLDYLGNFLGFGGKMETTPGLWLRVMEGDAGAVKDMVKYNKVDVLRLEQLYLRLRKYMKTHPHLGAISGRDKKASCPSCASEDLVTAKTRYTASGMKRVQVQCNKCHSYSTHAE